MLEYKHYYKENVETVVFVHGFGSDSNVFYKQMRSFVRKFNVIAIHLPGHANSPDTKSYGESFNLDSVIVEIVQTLNQLKIFKAHFVGISLGSVVLHRFLQRHPEYIRSVVLGGAVTRLSPLTKTVFQILNIMKGILPSVWIYTAIGQYMLPTNKRKTTREIFYNGVKQMKRDNFLDWLDVLNAVDFSYKKLHDKAKNIPKLYISGVEDIRFIDYLLEDIVNDKAAEIVLLENCGHICNMEDPKTFNASSIEFIEASGVRPPLS